MRKSCALALILTLFSLLPSVRADVLQPGERHYWWQWWKPAHQSPSQMPIQRITVPPQSPSIPFDLNVAVNVDQMRLVVPRNLLKDLKVAEAPAEIPLAGFADSRNTILAGIFLTLAFASGGLWMVRRGVPGVRTLAVGAGLLLLLGGAVVWADIPPFGGPRRNQLESFFREQQLEELKKLPQIAVDVIDHGDRITLVVGREQLAKLLEQNPPKPGLQE